MITRRVKISLWSIWLLVELLNLQFISSAFSQNRILTENFTNGDLVSPVKWQGDLSNFTSSKDSTDNIWLRLDDQSASGKSVIYTLSDVAYGSWTFTINLDFKPSASNNILVQLLSDEPDITQGGNGYALILGENGDGDVWRLLRYETGSPAEEVLRGNAKFADGGISKVKITRTEEGIWTLSTSTKTDGPLVVGTSAKDNLIKNAGYFGFVFSYTSTRSDKFYLDDISIDAFPAFLAETNITSGKDLVVTYSLPLGSGATDILLDDNVHPGSNNIDGNGKLNIHFQYDIQPGVHHLQISGLEDEYGYSIPDTAIHLSWPYHVKMGDLAISEFMYDPPSGLPEYVELFNKTAFPIKLNDWSIGDSSNRHDLPSAGTIKPEGFLVLTPDTSLLYGTFGGADYLQMDDWPVLNNGGDAVVVRDAKGSVIDSLTYESNWGGKGVSIERRSFEIPAIYSWNWSESENPDGGTPGKPNTATPDKKEPKILSLGIPDNQHVMMTWSDDVLDSSVTDPRHYRLDNQPAILGVTHVKGSDYRLSLSEKLENNVSYQFSVRDVSDWFGNTMAPFDTTISYYKLVESDSGQVFITEFMYDPPGDRSEYIELYNRGPNAVNLKDWLLSDSNNRKETISDARFILGPDQYVVLTGNVLQGLDGRNIAMNSRFPSLNNGGDQIKIYRKNGGLMDSLQYNKDWGGNGVSLERRSPEVSAWISSNWGDSPDPSGGTPGEKNKIRLDESAPDIVEMSINNAGDEIRLKMDEPIMSKSRKQPEYRLDPPIPITNAQIAQRDVTLKLDRGLEAGTNYSLSVLSLSDYFGNKLDTAITFTFTPDRKPPQLVFAAYNKEKDSVSVLFDEKIIDQSSAKILVNGKSIRAYQIDPVDSAKLSIPVSWKPNPESKGDDQLTMSGFSDKWHNTSQSEKISIARSWLSEKLLINEIMYNPIEDSHDNEPDQCEYVELYNDSNLSLDLRHIFIHDRPDENGNYKIRQTVSKERAWILPHGYVVFYADTSSSFRKSRLFQFFKPDSMKAHFYRVDRQTLSLTSTQGAVYLSNGKVTIDSVEYSDSWQNPDIVDTKGRSLERITINGPSNEKNNWTTSAADLGGSPGEQNTVFESPVISKQNEDKLLELAPNPFSPDGDGFQDNLILSYHLAKTGYRLRVRIFDRFGRLIRTLTNGKLAGSSGTLIWNGLNDNGKSNRIGFYIILFEAYGSKDGPDKELKKTVVLARHL